MTLICSIQGPGIGFLGMSDILLSRPGAQGQSVSLPFRVDPIQYVSGGTSLAGVAQKMVIAGDTLFQWAGSAAVARAAIKVLHKASAQGRRLVDVPVILSESGLSNAELGELSLIYHFRDYDIIKRYRHNCDDYSGHGYDLVAAGSGTWNYVENTLVAAQAPTGSHEEAFFSFIVRALYHSVSEVMSNSNYDFLYGGWIEIGLDEKQAFHKLPYAIKFWSVRGNAVNANLPVFFSWYKGKDLIVCRVDVRDIDASGSSKTAISIHQVNDFLRRPRSSRTKLPKIKWKPRIVCNVVIREGVDKVDVFIEKDQPENLCYKFSQSTGQTVMTFKRVLIDRVISGDSDLKLRYDIEWQTDFAAS